MINIGNNVKPNGGLIMSDSLNSTFELYKIGLDKDILRESAHEIIAGIYAYMAKYNIDENDSSNPLAIMSHDIAAIANNIYTEKTDDPEKIAEIRGFFHGCKQIIEKLTQPTVKAAS
jgi:hypothetical protein